MWAPAQPGAVEDLHGRAAAAPVAGGGGLRVKSLERENVRKLQGLVLCSASCYEDSQASMQQGHQCIERCHMLKPVLRPRLKPGPGDQQVGDGPGPPGLAHCALQ